MVHRGPVVTAVVAVGGLIGFMTANSAGALVGSNAAGGEDSGVQVPAPAEPPAQSDKPPQSSGEAPPPESPPKPPSESAQPPPAPEEPAPAPAFPAEVMYAGDATGSDLAIAVAVKGKQASAYLCDGDAVEDWLKGTAENGKLELSSRKGGSSLSASRKGERLVGTVSFRGQSLPFSISTAPPPAGLYRGENGRTTVGWIILPNGQQVGISNTAGAPAPAPELDPEQGYVTIDGMRVDAEQIEGDSTW